MSPTRPRRTAPARAKKAGVPEGVRPDAHASKGDLRERLEAAVGWVRESGRNFEWMDRALFWWKHFGWKRGLTVFTLFILPMVNAEWTKRIGEGLIALAAEHYGVEAKVGRWSGAWLGLHANAHDVVVSVRGPFAKKDLLRAATVSVDFSLLSRLRFGHWIKSVEIERPSIQVERALSGRWNWENVAGGTETTGALKVSQQMTTSDTSGAASPILIERLEMTDLRIEWMEHLPGNSGGRFDSEFDRDVIRR